LGNGQLTASQDGQLSCRLINEGLMRSVLTQSSTTSRVAFYDDLPERGDDLGYIRHQLDALAYARAVCEYRRLCERELAMLEAIHQLV
jgi:hypothetical protein